MSETVGVRELRQNLSKYLDRVKAGESLTVTERGREVAKLVPSGLSPTRRRLVEEFGATLGGGDLAGAIDRLPPRKPRPAGTADAILADLRRERV